jgi:hypothetical protein
MSTDGVIIVAPGPNGAPVGAFDAEITLPTNLHALATQIAASVLLGHPIPAILASVAIVCWLVLVRRTAFDGRERLAARSPAD